MQIIYAHVNVVPVMVDMNRRPTSLRGGVGRVNVNVGQWKEEIMVWLCVDVGRVAMVALRRTDKNSGSQQQHQEMAAELVTK